MYANELHIPAPSPEEGVAYTSLWLHIYSDEQLVEETERENWCSAVHMRVKCTESGTKQRDVTTLSPRWPVIAADQWPEPRDRGTEQISCYERHKLISQVQRPSVLSSSDVGRKWRLLRSILHPNRARDCLRDDVTATLARRKWRTE